MKLLLKNLSWFSENIERDGDIRIDRGYITEIGKGLISKKRENTIDYSGHFVYPGLINAHDHFEFNLYPILGTPPYSNYAEWSKDIHKKNERTIQAIQSVPLYDRLVWSAIKNIISGVTCVIHHNPYYKHFHKQWPNTFPIRVLKNYAWQHSLNLPEQTGSTFSAKKPFIIHAAEGTDKFCRDEIYLLESRGWLKSNTVIVHGIALTDSQIDLISQRNASLIWCPSSNLNIYKQTAPIIYMKDKIKIALGTDSTLTGSPTLLDEMKIALNTGLTSEKELFDMVTRNCIQIFPSIIFNEMHCGSPADLFILPETSSSYYANLMTANPSNIQLVLIGGNPCLIDDTCISQFNKDGPNALIWGKAKWMSVDLQSLKKRISKIVSDSILNQTNLWPKIQALTV